MRAKTWTAAATVAATLAACGGGDILAVVSFLGSAGGDWRFDDTSGPGFQELAQCIDPAEVPPNPANKTSPCVINIQRLDDRNFFSPDFNVRYTGNLDGCPPTNGRRDDTGHGERVALPGCFSGRYVTINEVVSDNGQLRAYFDSEVPDLRTGVWVEIQQEQRRFKFNDDPGLQDTTVIQGCELSAPAPNNVSMTVEAADISSNRLQTRITAFTAAGRTWTGGFIGLSAMRLVIGSEVLELERRNLSGSCPAP